MRVAGDETGRYGRRTGATRGHENSWRETWRNALWLAGTDIRRTWLSYPAHAVLALIAGYFAAFLLRGILELEGFGAGGERIERGYSNSSLDIWFLGLCPALMINVIFNRDYSARFRKDNMSRRMAFLRRLPISARELVLGRVLLMLLSLAVAGPIFFLTPYLLSNILSLPLAERLDWLQYLWFVLVWVGYTLLAGGFYLYMWLGFSNKGDVWGTGLLVLSWLLILGVANWVLGVSIVQTTLDLAESHGPIFALPLLLAGVSGFILWAWATTRRLQESRDLS